MTLANYVKELEEINLSIQKQNPNAILNVEEQKHMISLITDLHRYALDQIYNRKQ
jgi:hypothetical protein